MNSLLNCDLHKLWVSVWIIHICSEDEALDKIAKVLGLTPEAIKAFSEDAVFNIIANNFTDNSQNNNNYLCTINPLEKIIELYERLLASEKEKVELLKNQGK